MNNKTYHIQVDPDIEETMSIKPKPKMVWLMERGRTYENRPLWWDRREDGLRMDCVCKGAKKIPRGSPGDFIQLEYIETAL